VGYISASEDEEVAEARAKAIFAYMTSVKGIDANRINYRGEVPETDEDEGPQVVDAHAEAEDRKVEFEGQ
jgi:Tol biopolymer transport system component